MSKINIKKLSAVFAVLLLAGLVLAGSGAAANTASIGIQAVDSLDNLIPIEGASIVVTGNGITTPITGVTNSSGSWSYDGLSTSVEYTVIVQKDGYYNITTIYGGEIKVVALTIPEPGTAETFFIYQKVTPSELSAGTYMTIDKAHTLVVDYTVSSDGYFYIPETTVEGMYFLNGDDENTPIYIQKAECTSKELLMGTKLYSTYQFYARAYFAADVDYHIVLKVGDAGAFVKVFPGMTATDIKEGYENYPLDYYNGIDDNHKYQLTKEDVGTWSIYAEITGLKDTAPEEYKYVKLGVLKVVSKIDHTTTATIDRDTVNNGEMFTIFVTAPKKDKIYVGYRDHDDEDSFITIPVGSGGDTSFYLINGQVFQKGTSTEPYFEVPATGEVAISVVADTGLITDKRYTLVIRNPDNTDDGNQIEIELDITVKGIVFTAQLEKASYELGENVKILGTYENTFPLYFYVEGSNIVFQNIHYGSTGDYGTFKEKSNGIDWVFTINEKLMTGGNDGELTLWNPGTYTLYVSIVKNEKAVGASYTIEEKAAIIAGGKVLTITLTSPIIKIIDVQSIAEMNNYETITVETEGTDRLAFYVIGENQVSYIVGYTDTSKAEENGIDEDNVYQIYSLKSSDDDIYLYNKFPVVWTGLDNTVSNVLTVYGPKDYVGEDMWNTVEERYPGQNKHIESLIVKNTDGTYTANIYFPKSGWNIGQYYIVAQHPMANQKFDVIGVGMPDATQSYATGYNIYANPVSISDHGTFLFNIPSVSGFNAAQQLMSAIATYNDKCATTDITVKEEVYVILAGPSNIKKGETSIFTAKNSDGSDPNFIYFSSDASIASIDDDGSVYGVKDGQAYITAVSMVNGKSASKLLTVTKEIVPWEYSDTLILRAGWNFISVPMTLDSSMNTAGEFFEEVDMDNHSVLGYDSSTKSWVQLTSSTVLKPLDAYWVYSKENFVGTKKIVFDTQSPSIGNTKDIYKGWNAVGLNIDVTDGTNSLSAKSTFAGLDWNRYFEKYTTGTWKTIVNGGSSSESEEKYIYAGAGGWIYANEDGVLVGNAS